jgi:hypothetical protein
MPKIRRHMRLTILLLASCAAGLRLSAAADKQASIRYDGGAAGVMGLPSKGGGISLSPVLSAVSRPVPGIAGASAPSRPAVAFAAPPAPAARRRPKARTGRLIASLSRFPQASRKWAFLNDGGSRADFEDLRDALAPFPGRASSPLAMWGQSWYGRLSRLLEAYSARAAVWWADFH